MTSKKSTLQDQYEKEVVKKLQTELNRKNVHAIPKLEKVKINIGIGSWIRSGNKDFQPIIDNLQDITGQKPITNKSKKAISNFKLREGMPVGLTVTLRKKRMYDFINKLVNVVMPRMRDFRGISTKGFDKNGNYNIGMNDVSIFPEVNLENTEKIHGIQITVNTSAKTPYEGYLLLKELGFPFKDEIKPPTK
ncbi:MAG: 50S ribosomal protein L5 [Patescibacteria group bacterium]|nr:50S ribosomal protein L5 [Patescibacteria group bacterium]